MRSLQSPIRVRIISANPSLPDLLSSALGNHFTVDAAPDPDRGEAALFDNSPDAILLDFEPGLPYVELCMPLLAGGDSLPSLPVILMTGEENRKEALALVERGAYGCVRKPPQIPELRAMLCAAAEKPSLRGELATAERELEDIAGVDQLTGSSASMLHVYSLIRKVANLYATVLISGESGTGKELIARAIHNTGARANRPFVAVSCGAIPETLIEAELFGYEKGAFTGSVGTRAGYFEQVSDGTLFLDEIGELPLPTQVKLLRVLQEREFSRLGSSRSIPLRARVIVATHRDLEHMVSIGSFRQDLFYRVNVMNIAAPPLREHPQDIPALVHRFLQHYSEQYRKPLEGIELDALALLQRYNWPGNVRELENTIQRALIVTEGYTVGPADLPGHIRDQEPTESDDDMPAGSFEKLLRDYKYKLAKDAVEQCNGNKTLAAQSLSVSRAYLHRLLRHGPVPAKVGVTEMNIANSRLTLASGR